jgi:hypothetical protein
MGTISGQVHLQSSLYADQTGAILGGGTDFPGRRVRDVSNKIWLLDAQNTALTTLLRNIRKKHVTDPRFEWYEDAFVTQSTTCTADDSTLLDTSVAVTTGELGRAGDVWLNNNTAEMIYLSEVNSDVWTVVRAVGGSTAADWDAADVLLYIGNGMATGSIARASLTTQTSNKYNFTQIFKESFEISKTADTTKLWGGPHRQYLRQKHGISHTRDIEKAFWLGLKDDINVTNDAAAAAYFTASGGGVAYLTEGVFSRLTTNSATNSSNELTNAEFEVILEQFYRYGSDTKFLFLAPRGCTVIDAWARGNIQTVPSTSTYGIKIVRYESSHGNVNIIKNKLFYDWANTSGTPNYGKAAALLDLELLTYCYKRDTKLEMGIQENDRDSVEDQYLTECGLMLKNEECHGEIFDFDTA